MPRWYSDHRPLKTAPLTFLCCDSPYPESRTVILGCPLDLTASFRPGCRFAPNAIREASWNLESFSPALERDLEDLCVADIGDLLLSSDPQKALTEVQQAVEEILSDGKVPVILGGEHLLSLGSIRAFRDLYPEVRVLQIDAHADFRDEYLGASLSHATVMRRVSEELGPGRVFQVGVRSWDRKEREEARGMATFLGEGPPPDLPPEVLRGPLYVSLDLDVLDPSVCPGVGTPEPGGWSFKELLGFLYGLPWERVIGVDMVELAPPHDPSGTSAVVSAKVLREILLMLGEGCRDFSNRGK